jgi:hypothetical protein
MKLTIWLMALAGGMVGLSPTYAEIYVTRRSRWWRLV